MRITSAATADATAFDPQDDHYDPDSDPKKPRWLTIDITLEKKLKRLIPLTELRRYLSSKMRWQPTR